MHERIKHVREVIVDISQRAFADRIGITGPSVALLESGKNKPSEQTIRAICREFKISRTWLETGEGDPQVPGVEDDMIVDDVLRGEDEFIKAVIRGIAKTPGGWEKMREVFNAIRAELDAQEQKKEAE